MVIKSSQIHHNFVGAIVVTLAVLLRLINCRFIIIIIIRSSQEIINKYQPVTSSETSLFTYVLLLFYFFITYESGQMRYLCLQIQS